MDTDSTITRVPATQTHNSSQPVAAELGRFGLYELLDIYPGGMGVVYRARHTVLDTVVALKMPRVDRLRSTLEHDRFKREAESIARLRHTNIVEILDYNEVDGRPYLTMEFIGGGNLAYRLPEYTQDSRRAVALMEKVARAVHHAHECGVLHRDLKPANILIRANGEPVVVDFGLAKLVNADAELTATGQLLGTPAYMAPEQILCQNHLICPATDVYALGVTLFEILTGRRPFAGQSRDEVTPNVLTMEPQFPPNVSRIAPAGLDLVVLRCLCKNPKNRYATAKELADDLALWLAGQKPRTPRPLTEAQRRRRKFLAAGAALIPALGLAAGAAWWATRPKVNPPAPPTELEILQKELVDTRRLVLLGETDDPRWMKPLTKDVRVLPREQYNGVFTVQSDGWGLIELMPNVGQNRFRFSAEVRHLNSAIGSTGLFVGHQQYHLNGSALSCFLLHSFAEDGVLARDFLNRPAIMTKTEIIYLEKTARRRSMGSHRSKTLPREGSGWRQIVIEYDVENIQSFLDGELITSTFRGWLVSQTVTMAAPDFNRLVGVTPQYLPTQPLGLAIDRSLVQFRNVRIDLLDP